jgi:electron transfer flavoprotein alpha subunit
MTLAGTLVLIDHDRGELVEASLRAATMARSLGEVEAVVIGDGGEAVPPALGEFGVGRIHHIRHELLTDYAPEAWGHSLAQLVGSVGAEAVLATGSDRGNEVMAHLAARLDLPFVANCTEIETGEEWQVTRVRWGGSLLERASLAAPIKLATVGEFAVAAEPAEAVSSPEVVEFVPSLDEVRTIVVDREPVAAGVTLATAPVVVSGGRGVGSPEGFGVLEELAGLLGGAVGCSRVATNNGWRSHADQVGQTGTRVAPDLYIACGISGAMQHWVGMMASKRILAINTDPEAPMVTKADYAVIGDVAEVLPAVVAEVVQRKS